MKKIVIAFSLFLVLACGEAFAEIIQTPNLAPIEAAIKKADSGTLVIFDVDDVLIIAKDQVLQPIYDDKFVKKLEKDLENRHSEVEIQKLWSILWLTRLDEPVDPQMIPLIKELQAKGVKVMALTNAWTGPFGNISSLENWRIKELESLGYTFQNSWNNTKTKVFSNLNSKDPKRFPVFKGGVLFTCHLPKGKVLEAFLRYAGLSFQDIIFIDDKRKNLKSVETYCQKTGKKFIGFQYTAVVQRPAFFNSLNEKRARLQFEVLEKEHKWLNDQEADLRINP